MSAIEATLESIGRDSVIDAGESIEQAGDLALFMLKFGGFIADNPWLIIGIPVAISLIILVMKKLKQ